MTAYRWRDQRMMAMLAFTAVAVAYRVVTQWLGSESSLNLGELGLVFVWAVGHCDGMDGPVVTLAKRALDSGNVNLVLGWVRAEDEAEIRCAFEHASSVRKLGPQARELADLHFFETLVRVHRAGEGAPYDGLKPAGRDLGPAILAADRALMDGSIDKVVALLTEAIRKGVHEHFHAAMHRKQFVENDIKASRAYVEAYVPYVHYVERLWQAATGEVHGHHDDRPTHEH